MALVVLATSLIGCSGRIHDQKDGCYALTPLPTGILRDECQLVTDAGVQMGARMTAAGYVIDMRFRFSEPGQAAPVDVAMAGRFAYSEETFLADGQVLNVYVPIGGQSCRLDALSIHLDGVTDPADSGRFSGVARIQTSALRPQSCVCQAWFEYQAALSSSANICP